MAIPPFSFSSFSTIPPPPPPPPPPDPSASPPPPDPAPQAQQPAPTLPAPRSEVSTPVAAPAAAPAPAPAAVPTPAPAPVPPVPRPAVVAATPTGPAHVPLLPAPRRTRRWLWPLAGSVLGLVAGVGAGHLVGARQPAEYRSTARVTVTGTADPGDLARSPKVLERAALGLDAQGQFQVAPPAAPADRVVFLKDRLEVTRDPDGSVTLSFTAADPADAPRYLRAVVDAYRAEAAATRPGQPSTDAVDAEIRALAAELTKLDADRARVDRELAAAEDPAAVGTRLTASRATLDGLREKKAAVERDLALIRNTGPSRRERLATMEKLGVKPDRSTAAAPSRPSSRPATPPAPTTPQAADDALLALEQRRAELGRRLGPDHPQMRAIDRQIAALKEQMAKAEPKPDPKAEPKQPEAPAPAPVARGGDELDRHRVKLEADRDALAKQIGKLEAGVARDEQAIGAVDRLKADQDRLVADRRDRESRLREKEQERARLLAAAPTGGPAVQTVSPPTEGVAVATAAATRPSPLVLGGLIGLLVGGGLGLVAAAAGRGAAPRPRRAAKAPAEDVPRLGVPVFGQVPHLRTDLPAEKVSGDGLNPTLVSFYRPSSAEAEAFREARRGVTAALHHRGHQVLAVTSPGPGDGKSTVAANLAISLAQSGKRVILVDCDLRSPRVQELFRLTRLGDGLKAVMTADVDLRMAVRGCEVGNLFLLPAGRGKADPAEMLSRPKFRELLSELRSSYEFVILDAPPATAGPELGAVGPLADGAVLVVRAGADAVPRAEWANGQVAVAGTRVLGAVLNAAPAPAAAVAPPEPATPATPAEAATR